jgi:pilus retraction protein PilT
MNIKSMLGEMSIRNASDLFCHVGGTVRFNVDGKLVSPYSKLMTGEDLAKAVEDLTTPRQREVLREKLDVDFALHIDEMDMRFRVNIFMQRGQPSIVIRSARRVTQSFQELGLPAESLEKLALQKRGLVLLTGTMGSGKSTTIASMLDYINTNSSKHILTVEEPIEYVFEDNKSIINQRELGLDVSSYKVALRAFTLQSPDVMFIGNIRDLETMSSAIMAAETGVLVLSTLHTINAPQSVERIINFFPEHQHQEVRNQLSFLLRAVISLRLIPRKDGRGRIPAYEIMLQTPMISNLIRENRIHEIAKYIEEGELLGMQSFNQSLVKLVKENMINEQQATEFSDQKDELSQALRGIVRKGV